MARTKAISQSRYQAVAMCKKGFIGQTNKGDLSLK